MGRMWNLSIGFSNVLQRRLFCQLNGLLECLDKLIWNSLGLFTVGRSYSLNCVGESSGNVIWKQIWRMEVHDRL